MASRVFGRVATGAYYLFGCAGLVWILIWGIDCAVGLRAVPRSTLVLAPGDRVTVLVTQAKFERTVLRRDVEGSPGQGWKVTLVHGADEFPGAPAQVGDLVLLTHRTVGETGHRTDAYDRDTGEHRWTYRGDHRSAKLIELPGGTIGLHEDSLGTRYTPALTVLSMDTGEVLWRTDLERWDDVAPWREHLWIQSRNVLEGTEGIRLLEPRSGEVIEEVSGPKDLCVTGDHVFGLGEYGVVRRGLEPGQRWEFVMRSERGFGLSCGAFGDTQVVFLAGHSGFGACTAAGFGADDASLRWRRFLYGDGIRESWSDTHPETDGSARPRVLPVDQMCACAAPEPGSGWPRHVPLVLTHEFDLMGRVVVLDLEEGREAVIGERVRAVLPPGESERVNWVYAASWELMADRWYSRSSSQFGPGPSPILEIDGATGSIHAGVLPRGVRLDAGLLDGETLWFLSHDSFQSLDLGSAPWHEAPEPTVLAMWGLAGAADP